MNVCVYRVYMYIKTDTHIHTYFYIKCERSFALTRTTCTLFPKQCASALARII